MSSNQPAETIPIVRTTIGTNNGERSTSPANREVRKSYQLRALSRKTLAYQKRQTCTNVCCVSLCPIVMVFLAVGMAGLINSLISRNNPIQEVLYCSAENGLDKDLKFPIFNSTNETLPVFPSKGIPGATLDKITHLNYLRPSVGTALGTTGPPAGLALTLNKPCVYWFGSKTPYGIDEVYNFDPALSKTLDALDATFWPQPAGGWFGFKTLSSANLSSYLAQLQNYPWYVISVSPSVNLTLLGSNDKKTALSFTIPPDFSSYPSYLLQPANVSLPFKNISAANGILDALEIRYFFDYDATAGLNASAKLQPVPWFTKTDGNTDQSLDAVIGQKITEVIQNIASINKSIVTQINPPREELTKFYAQIGNFTRSMPYGGIYFETVDVTAKKFKMTLNTGRDIRLDRAVGYPPKGLRQAIQISQLSNGFLRYSSPSLATASITQGIRSMPAFGSTEFKLPFGSLIGRILYPFGVSFLLPIFVIILVKEKEDRILIMMQMNGLKKWTYYVSHYVHFYCLHIVSSAFFLISGRIGKLDMFVNTQSGVLILVFFIWGHAQVAMSLWLSSMFSKNRTALVVVFLVVLTGVIISLSFDQLYEDQAIPEVFFIWPPFAFYRILSVINKASYTTNAAPYTISMIKPGDEVFAALIFMIGEVFVFFLLAAYFSSVIPSEYGVPRPWYWPITWVVDKIKKSSNYKMKDVQNTRSSLKVAPDANELTLEDADVKAERARVTEDRYDPTSPLVMQGMRKVYPSRGGLGPKLAVKDVTVAVEKGIVFGLLGPNGAGKTTLISILTGLYRATSGIATIAGFDNTTERDEVYKILGVCPQHDILWDDLTVEEHLLFYARLKGVKREDEKASVEESMKTVSLAPFKDRLSKGLSGGEKRRLSIAIALVGNPSVVFLDEPTTGLDPEVRRLIWNIVDDSRKGRTIVLTTHSMEEAEVLCQRIGIMAKGTLRCIGPQLRLKQLYGSGFRMQFICGNPQDTPAACAYIESLLPPGWKKLDSFATNVSYEFLPSPGLISSLFEEIEKEKKNYGIVDWGLSQTTLEEVFIRLISETDANAD